MSDEPDHGERLITDAEHLEDALDVMDESKVLAVDTEFHWERTYLPILALVQVACRDEDGEVHAWAIDPFEVELEPLVELLMEPERIKVFHAGRIDLQILHGLAGEPVTPVFDTQKAAALAGFGHQVGYANLVEAMTGQKIGKAEQYSDWTKRPLRASQIDYALLDVIPLLDVYHSLCGLLEQSNRLSWAAEEMAPLTEPETYVELPDRERYTKIKAHRSLDRRSLAILRELAAWREREAAQRDIRPGFVVKDRTLLDMARRPPKHFADLKKVRGLHPKLIDRSGKDVLKVIKKGRDTQDLPPQPKRHKRTKRDVGPAVDLLRAYVGNRADQVDVASEVLATTSDLERLAKAHARGEAIDEHPLTQGWRGKLLGGDLVRLLEGELSLGLDPETGAMRVVD